MMKPRFFISYAHDDYKIAQRHFVNGPYNYLHFFLDVLIKKVSSKRRESTDSVAFFDKDRIQITDFWDRRLLQYLQGCPVCVCVLSCKYLNSESCMRELHFFIERFNLLEEQFGNQDTHRILPIFWESRPDCFYGAKRQATGFIDRLQWWQGALPENYPTKGMLHIVSTCPRATTESICEILADRICELSDEGIAQMPMMPDIERFETFLPAFVDDEVQPAVKMASGPRGTNVVYAVGTREQMDNMDGIRVEKYGDQPSQWRPFERYPGATIEILTKEGLNVAGQTERYYCNLEMPRDLIVKIEQAGNRNSPLLIVLDGTSLRATEINGAMREYDNRNFRHVGLVTASNQAADDELMRHVFEFKRSMAAAHHIWTTSPDREDYVRAVADVIGGLKRVLMQTAEPNVLRSGGIIPRLVGPTG